MDRRMLFAGLVIVLVASVLMARPGSLVTGDGDKLKGDITFKDGFVTVTPPNGESTKLDARNVTKITFDDPLDQQYYDQHQKLDAKDVKGRIALANWATAHDRSDLALEALFEARKIDPMDKEAAHLQDVAQSQYDMDQKAKTAAAHPTTRPDATAGVPTTNPATGVAAAPPKPARKLADRRLLTTDEINTIRQKEMPTDDPKVTIRFDNQVVKKYLATAGKDAAVAFGKMTPEQQALEILTNGTAEMAKDIHVMTDPTPLLEFKNKVMPILATSCASAACHGGNKAGDFGLFMGNATPNTYTNFYILQTYTTTIAGTSYVAMDRSTPDRSLVLQFGLPLADGQPPHPAVPGYKPRFKSVDDPAYKTVLDYIKGLPPISPDYKIDVSPKLPVAADAGATTKPAAP